MATTTTEFARGRSSRSLAPTQLQKRAKPGPLALTAAAAALLCATSAGANEFKFVPNVTLGETYTDNVALSARGNERSDFVTSVAPGFTVTRDSARLQLRASYSLQALLYANHSSGTSLSNFLDGSAHGTLIQDLLLFDAHASINQANNSSFGPQALSNVNVNSNRVETRTYSISPYLEQRFGNASIGQLRYAHEAVSSSNVFGNLPATIGLNGNSVDVSKNSLGFGNSNTDRLVGTLTSGPAFRTFNWGTTASFQNVSFQQGDAVRQSSVSGNVGYLIGPNLRATAAGGYEKDTYVTVGDKPQGAFYNAGFIWTPSSRTNVTATAGHRFFGPTYALAISHRARLATFNLNYNEDITSTQAQALLVQSVNTADSLNQLLLASIPDTAARQRAVENLIQSQNLPAEIATATNALTNRYFLQKNLQASIAATGVRNTLLGSFFITRREPQSNVPQPVIVIGGGFGSLDDNSRSVGASGVWSYKFSPRTVSNANLSYSRTHSLTNEQSTSYKVARLGVTTAFQPKLNGSLEVRRTLQNSNLLGGEVRENAITASMRMQF